MTDEEKREMRNIDAHAREILERTVTNHCHFCTTRNIRYVET